NPPGRFKGTFLGRMALTGGGSYLYVVDQGGFQGHVIDTRKIVTGTDANGRIVEPNNFGAVVGHVPVGRYPFDVSPSPDRATLCVAHVGIFQYTHLRPPNPTGDPNQDYPLGYPGAGYPDETETSRTIKIKKVNPSNLPPTLRDPEGIRVGYIPHDTVFTVPCLGSPNVPQSSSVYALNIGSSAVSPAVSKIVKTGPLVGDVEFGFRAYGGSHPNSVAVGANAIYVANRNSDSISILNPKTYEEIQSAPLNVFREVGRTLKGVEPVALALSPDAQFLYVAEAGINAIGVLRLNGRSASLIGHIPTGWWPSAIQVSADGRTLYVANARGRGAGPNNNGDSPKASTLGTVNIIPVPTAGQLADYTNRVLKNNGFVTDTRSLDANSPIPTRAGERS